MSYSYLHIQLVFKMINDFYKSIWYPYDETLYLYANMQLIQVDPQETTSIEMSFLRPVFYKEYKKNCFVFWEIFSNPWPKNLDCSSLPDVNDTTVCIGYQEAHEPPDVKGMNFLCLSHKLASLICLPYF